MEYCEGNSLKQKIDQAKKSQRPLEEVQIFRYLEDICQGL